MINNMNCDNLKNLKYYNSSNTNHNNSIDLDEYYENFYN